MDERRVISYAGSKRVEAAVPVEEGAAGVAPLVVGTMASWPPMADSTAALDGRA